MQGASKQLTSNMMEPQAMLARCSVKQSTGRSNQSTPADLPAVPTIDVASCSNITTAFTIFPEGLHLVLQLPDARVAKLPHIKVQLICMMRGSRFGYVNRSFLPQVKSSSLPRNPAGVGWALDFCTATQFRCHSHGHGKLMLHQIFWMPQCARPTQSTCTRRLQDAAARCSGTES